MHLSLGPTEYGPDGDATLWVDADGLHERVITTPEVLAALFEEIHAAEPGLDFVAATGDLTNNGTEEELATYARIVEASPVPVVSIPGNHDHHSALAAAAAGHRLPYEVHVGPRWASFDAGGVHVAHIDWFTHRLGFDTAAQDEWLAADLGAVPDGVPIVLLTHDQMSASFYDGLPRRPVLTLSGHWHTSRVVAHEGTLHVNTGPATFAGLDYCPPHYRVVEVDGHDVAVRTIVRGRGVPEATMRSTATPIAPRGRGTAELAWIAPLGAGAQLAGAVAVSDVVVVAAKSEDTPAGRLVGFERESGAERWALDLRAAVKATPAAAGGTVVAATVDGEVIRVDAATGAVQWTAAIHDDPLHLWTYMPPLVHDGLVVTGDVGAFAALDLATGSVRWRRGDLGQRENMTTVARPAVAGGLLIGTFVAQAPALFALDPHTGTSAWPEGGARSIYGDEANPAIDLPQVVVGGITPDPDGDDVYVIRLGQRVERVRAADGAVVWSAPFFGWFNPAPPVVVGDAVVAAGSTGQLWCYDRATGSRRWSVVVTDDAPVAMGAYRFDGPSMLAPPLPVGDRLVQPAGDGRLVTIEIATGVVTGEVDLGSPVTAPLTMAGDLLIAVGVDGWVRALPVAQLLK